MAHLQAIYDINQFDFTKLDSFRCFLRSLHYEKYTPGKIYHKGDRVTYVVDKGLTMLRCKVENSSPILVTDEWEEYTVDTKMEEILVFNDERKVVEDVHGIKAGTDINGMDLKTIISKLVYVESEPYFLHEKNIFLDMETGIRNHLEIDIHYKEASDPIDHLEIIYRDNVIETLIGGENATKIVLDIDDSDSPHQPIYYKAYYRNDRLPSTGVIAKVFYVYPTYVGPLNMDDFDISGMKKMYIEPNSDIECVKNDNSLASLAIIVQEDSWRQITGCFLEDHTNIMSSILSTEKYIDGYLYKIFYSYPTIASNIKLRFSFKEDE